jgi:hypothetical protein
MLGSVRTENTDKRRCWVDQQRTSSRVSGALLRCPGICATIIYLLCVGVYFYPLLPEFSTSLLGPPGDNMQDLWNTWYSQKVIDSDATKFFFTRRIHSPEGSSLIYHSFSYTNLILISLIRIVLRLPLNLTVLVTLHNLMLFFSLSSSVL